MKFRFLVKLVENVLGVSINEDEPRADMCLPTKVLALGVVLIVAGIVMAIVGGVGANIALLLLGVALVPLGIVAVMCWKNQSIQVLSEEKFEYTTFLGKKHIYEFRKIIGLRKNQDSFTLFVGDEKVHIESCAFLSDRLAELINQSLSQASRQTEE